ncbi:MAG: oxygenase MpaB family protein [Acidimicrobiales bacterium]
MTPDPPPPLDHGFLGPDSVAWRVFRHPSSFTVGFLRTVVTEMFDPFLLASVADTGATETRTSSRYARTLEYVATAAFADSQRAVHAADVLYRIHDRIRGIEPISGQPFDANDPDQQLWIHLTQWHSVLFCYELVGPGPLSAADEARYWHEGRVLAELQTIDPDTVPRNRAEMRDYYRRVRPRLAVTEDTQRIVANLLGAPGTLATRGSAVAGPVVRAATIATLPGWLRRLAGLRQPAAIGAAALRTARVALQAMDRRPEHGLMVLADLSRGAHDVVAPRVREVEPTKAVVRTPAEAFAAAGLVPPRHRFLDSADRAPKRAEAPRDRGPEALLELA